MHETWLCWFLLVSVTGNHTPEDIEQQRYFLSGSWGVRSEIRISSKKHSIHRTQLPADIRAAIDSRLCSGSCRKPLACGCSIPVFKDNVLCFSLLSAHFSPCVCIPSSSASLPSAFIWPYSGSTWIIHVMLIFVIQFYIQSPYFHLRPHLPTLETRVCCLSGAIVMFHGLSKSIWWGGKKLLVSMEKAHEVVRKFNVDRSIFQSWETPKAGDSFLKSYDLIPWLESKTDSRYPKTISLPAHRVSKLVLINCYFLFVRSKPQIMPCTEEMIWVVSKRWMSPPWQVLLTGSFPENWR